VEEKEREECDSDGGDDGGRVRYNKTRNGNLVFLVCHARRRRRRRRRRSASAVSSSFPFDIVLRLRRRRS
jgi:hypothetical protein